jgi:hypothetical protein
MVPRAAVADHRNRRKNTGEQRSIGMDENAIKHLTVPH